MDDKSQQPPAPAVETKAACGGRLDHPARYPSALYRGQKVYFCSAACLRAFEQAPDRFMAGEIEHPADAPFA